MHKYNSTSKIIVALELNPSIELDFDTVQEVFPLTVSSGLQFDEPSMESIRNFCNENLINIEIITSSDSQDLPRYIFKKHDHR